VTLLAREAALAEVLDVINRSPGDPAPVFAAILERAHRLCDAAMGSLGIFDGEHFRALATHGFQERIASQVRQPFRPHRYMRPLVDGARLIIEPDLQALNSNDRVVHGVVAAGARTTLVVPLRKDGNLVGYISEFRREVRLFSETEIALLTTFAAQAVIAMDNARLITEQREALEQQTATAEILQVINASPGNLAPVFDAMREKAMRLCDAAFGNFST
jgi:GAF domain-containing protein